PPLAARTRGAGLARSCLRRHVVVHAARRGARRHRRRVRREAVRSRSAGTDRARSRGQVHRYRGQRERLERQLARHQRRAPRRGDLGRGVGAVSARRVTAPRTVLAAAIDILAIGAFAASGRSSHAETLDAAGLWRTAWPFLAGLAVVWLVAFVWRRPFDVW